MLELETSSVEETQAVGAWLGARAAPGWVIGLEGDLGAGKTTFVQGLASGIGAPPEEVTSPTFTLMQEYSGRIPLIHVDLYRLESPAEAEDVGITEAMEGSGCSVIEWFDKLGPLRPARYLRIVLRVTGTSGRRLALEGAGDGWEELLSDLDLHHAPAPRK